MTPVVQTHNLSLFGTVHHRSAVFGTFVLSKEVVILNILISSTKSLSVYSVTVRATTGQLRSLAVRPTSIRTHLQAEENRFLGLSQIDDSHFFILLTSHHTCIIALLYTFPRKEELVLGLGQNREVDGC